MRHRKSQRNREVFAEWIIGVQQKDIARHFGLSRSRVCRIISDELPIVQKELQKTSDKKKQREDRIYG